MPTQPGPGLLHDRGMSAWWYGPGIAGMVPSSLAGTALTLTGRWKQGDPITDNSLVSLGKPSWLWPFVNVSKGNANENV